MIAVALTLALLVVFGIVGAIGFVRADRRDRARMRQQTKTACPDCTRGTCRGCGQEVDDRTCYCGEPIPGCHDNHNPVPMGCECHLRTPEEIAEDLCST